VSDLIQRIAHVPIAFQKVEDGLSENFKCETHVSEIVERIEHCHTEVLAGGILAVQLLQHVDLQFCCLSIFVDVLNDFHRDVIFIFVIFHFHHLPECSLAQRGHYFISITDKISW